MDYKYITQLLERYWNCETSLEEEAILRTFFSQKDVPAELLPYKDLFTYEANEKKAEVLGDDFDQKILSMIEEPQPVKARVVTMRQRLMPLFKAAAVVAIFLTLGNAAQVSCTGGDDANTTQGYSVQHQKGESVAMGDSSSIDSLQHSSIETSEVNSNTTILK